MGHAEGHNPFHVLNVGETTYNREPVMYFYLCPLNGGTCLSQTAPSPFIRMEARGLTLKPSTFVRLTTQVA